MAFTVIAALTHPELANGVVALENRIQHQSGIQIAIAGIYLEESGVPMPVPSEVSIGYLDGFIGEGQISYAGPGALARGKLALEIVRQRLKLTGVATSELRFDLIGVDSLHGERVSAHAAEPYEVRVRVTGRTDDLREVVRIGIEVETHYTNGPAAGGGAWKSALDVVAVVSVLLPRELASPQVLFFGSVA